MGLPMEDRNKGPYNGIIPDGAVNWTCNLMWMLQAKIQQQDDFISLFPILSPLSPPICSNSKPHQSHTYSIQATHQGRLVRRQGRLILGAR